MPSILTVFGYKIFFWSNENGEPIHVHICKGNPTANATKVWLTSKGGTIVCHNKSRISKSELNKILSVIEKNRAVIEFGWLSIFGNISYYC